LNPQDTFAYHCNAAFQQRKDYRVLEPFDHRQLRLLVTAVSAQRLFWTQQEALAHAAMDAELGALASRHVRDHDGILQTLRTELGSSVAVEKIVVPVKSRA
jgi:hypothetical protein